MENMTDMREKIHRKVLQAKPYLPDEKAWQLTDRLLRADGRLAENLREWVEGKELSDIWIRDKYCIGAVLKIRRSNDFISAFLALDEYAKDEANEAGIWQTRA